MGHTVDIDDGASIRYQRFVGEAHTCMAAIYHAADNLYDGILSGHNAIVMGQFTDCILQAHDPGLQRSTALDCLLSKVYVPILTRLLMDMLRPKCCFFWAHRCFYQLMDKTPCFFERIIKPCVTQCPKLSVSLNCLIWNGYSNHCRFC